MARKKKKNKDFKFEIGQIVRITKRDGFFAEGSFGIVRSFRFNKTGQQIYTLYMEPDRYNVNPLFRKRKRRASYTWTCLESEIEDPSKKNGLEVALTHAKRIE